MAKSIKLNTIFKTSMSFINILFPLLTSPYIARILSVDGFTEGNKAMSLLSWFSPFAVFGVYTYGMRTISQIKNDKKVVASTFTKLFCFSCMASVFVTLVFVLFVLLNTAYSNYRTLYLIYSTQIIIICFATDWANEAFENYGFLFVKSFFCRLLYVVSVFIFVKKPDDVIINFILISITGIVNNILTFAYTKIHIPFVKVSFKDIFSLTKPLFIVFLLVNSSMLFTILDRFVLTMFGNKLDLTYYTMSQNLVNAIVQVSSSVLLVSIPRLSFYWGNKNIEGYSSLLKKSVSCFFAIHTPCCIGLALIAKEIVYFYAGTKYILANVTFLFFSLRYYLSGFDMVLSKQILLATGNEKVLTKVYYIGGFYNVICKVCLILLNNLSPSLCVITTASSDLLIICLQLYEIKKIGIKIKYLLTPILKYFLYTLLFLPIVLITKNIFPFDSNINIISRSLIIIFGCVVLYALILLITKDDFVDMVLRRKKHDE